MGKIAARTRPCRNASGVPQQGYGKRCALFPLSACFHQARRGTYVGNHIDQMPEETVIWLFRQQVNNYSDIYEARRLIEVAVYESCFMHRTDAIVQNIRKYVTAIARAYEDNVSPEEFTSALRKRTLMWAKTAERSIL